MLLPGNSAAPSRICSREPDTGIQHPEIAAES